MKKVYLFSIIFVGLFCLASLVAAVSIPDPLKGATFDKLLKKIATTVAELVGAIGTIMIIIAGIFYLTSAGSPERIGVAKKTLMYAIAGMVIGLSASAIVGMVAQIAGTGGG